MMHDVGDFRLVCEFVYVDRASVRQPSEHDSIMSTLYILLTDDINIYH